MHSGSADLMIRPHLKASSSDGQYTKPSKKEQRKLRRRRQLAAALIEADNDDIERRVNYLTQYDAASSDIPALLSVAKFATQSVMLSAAATDQTQENDRPVYTYPLNTMQELSRKFLGLSAQWEGDDSSHDAANDDSLVDLYADEDSKLGRVEIGHLTFGSPLTHVLHDVQDIQTSSNQVQASTPVHSPRRTKPPHLSASVSMPQLSQKALTDSRGEFLLQRIQHLQEHPEPTPNPDISTSSQEDTSATFEDVGSSSSERHPAKHRTSSLSLSSKASLSGIQPISDSTLFEQRNALGIQLGSDSEAFFSFRQRVLRGKEAARNPSGRRHSLSVSGWPGEMHSVAEEAGFLYDKPLDGLEPNPVQFGQQEPLSDMENKHDSLHEEGDKHYDGSHGTNNNDGSTHNHQNNHVTLRAKQWAQKFNPFRSLDKKRAKLSNVHTDPSDTKLAVSSEYPQLDGLSPVLDVPETSAPNSAAVSTPKDDALTGVSLHSPMTNPYDMASDRAPSSANTLRPNELLSPSASLSSSPPSAYPSAPQSSSLQAPPSAVEQMPLMNAKDSSFAAGEPIQASLSFYMNDANTLRHGPSWIPTYICIPMPLENLPIDVRDTQTDDDDKAFFAPHGAFILERGVILPSIQKNAGTYGPVQVPVNIGRRVLHPSTALFRNVLVQRDDEREGWGWERHTNASRYFADLQADDDDSDDELPLMDVRIQARDEWLAQKRQHRERVRRRQAKRERQRLRVQALEKGVHPSEYGVSEQSSDDGNQSGSDTTIDDGDELSEESDPERPWVDDKRPAGRLYGSSLIEMAMRQKQEQQQTARYYGRESMSANHMFTNDTKARMQRLFGEVSLWDEEMQRHQTSNQSPPAVAGTSVSMDEPVEPMLEPGAASAIVYPAADEVLVMEEAALDCEDDHVGDTWDDTSSSSSVSTSQSHNQDEQPRQKRLTYPIRRMARYSRNDPNRPRWLEKGEDDVPLAALRDDAEKYFSSSDEDVEPLGARHPQAEVIAEKEALIRRLQEENAQARMLLLRSSMQMHMPMPYMPWMMPPSMMPSISSEAHSLLGDDTLAATAAAATEHGELTDDVPVSYMYDPNVHAHGMYSATPAPVAWSVDDAHASE